jgi:hypothetical protein
MDEHEIIKLLDLSGLQMISYQVDEMAGIPIYKEYVLAKSAPGEMIPPSFEAIEKLVALVQGQVAG